MWAIGSISAKCKARRALSLWQAFDGLPIKLNEWRIYTRKVHFRRG